VSGEVSSFTCPRPDCADFGELDRDNIRFHHAYGSSGWSMLRCRSCGRSFSERRGTPFFRFQIPTDKILDILWRLSEGESMRRVALSEAVDKNTVLKVLKVATKRPRWFQLAMVRDFQWPPNAADSVFAYVRSKARDAHRKGSIRRGGPSEGPTTPRTGKN
jgi:transposase-like protein